MTKIKIALVCISVLLLQYVTISNTTASNGSSNQFAVVNDSIPKQKTVSWQKDIYPILKDRCAPCHFSPDGKKEHLDTYDASVEYIDDIIEFIQLPKDQKKFMPFKSKKEPLSDSLITVFKLWKSQDMPK